MGRKSMKQVGALVEMHRRKVKGLGIILDRVSKADTVALPDKTHRYNETFRGGAWNWECRNADPSSTFVMVQWFSKPSEYSDEPMKGQWAPEKAWYPISYLKVVSGQAK